MLEFGKYNTLEISRRTDNGFYLVDNDGDVQEEVLLPKKFITEEMKEGDKLNVFVYKDSEDRPVATTQTPLAQVGQAEYLLVKEVTNIGAFLDWGLDKDLFLPFREQAEHVEAGRYYLVYLFLDYASKRIAATTNLNKFIKNREVDLVQNQEVDLLITYENEVGIRVIINNKHWGILFKNEVFKKIEKGTHVQGFVKKIREDGKIDVALQKQGIEAAKDVREVLLEKLKEHKGFLPLSDVTPPEVIHEMLGISKKNFKKAVGILFKEGRIELKDNLIRLILDKEFLAKNPVRIKQDAPPADLKKGTRTHRPDSFKPKGEFETEDSFKGNKDFKPKGDFTNKPFSREKRDDTRGDFKSKPAFRPKREGTGGGAFKRKPPKK